MFLVPCPSLGPLWSFKTDQGITSWQNWFIAPVYLKIFKAEATKEAGTNICQQDRDFTSTSRLSSRFLYTFAFKGFITSPSTLAFVQFKSWTVDMDAVLLRAGDSLHRALSSLLRPGTYFYFLCLMHGEQSEDFSVEIRYCHCRSPAHRSKAFPEPAQIPLTWVGTEKRWLPTSIIDHKTEEREELERRSDLTNKTCFSLSCWQVVADVTLSVFQGSYNSQKP